MTAGERLIEKGREEGHREGRQEGRQEGQRGLLLKQLATRFGALPDAAVAMVRSATSAELEAWAERVLTAPTLGDVLGGS